MPPKAMALFSGGLDSILAMRLMREQGVEITALHILTPFFLYNPRRDQAARQIASRLGVPICVYPVAQDYMEIICHPQHGRGMGMNPCVDCRIFMYRIARSKMEEAGADFIFTGDVVGERPMTQRHHALRLIDREAGVQGLVLRPLSARLLPPTSAEEKGLIDRGRLLAISGRSRAPQMSLAKKLGVDYYPSPGGGCLLTDITFSPKIAEALAHNESSIDDMHLLRYGRHYRLSDGARLAVGRRRLENRALLGMARRGDFILRIPEDLPGPTAVLRRFGSEASIHLAAQIVAALSDLGGQGRVPVEIFPARQPKKANMLYVKALPSLEVENLRITSN